MEIVCVPTIVMAVYTIMELYKKIAQKTKAKEVLYKIIPLIALLIGGAFGVILFYLAPNFITALNVWVALITGACSGLSAVGCNQIFKQLKKAGVEVLEIDTSKYESTKTDLKEFIEKLNEDAGQEDGKNE